VGELEIAFDTATAATVVAASSPHELVTRRHDPGPGERPGHTAQLMALIEEAVVACGGTLGDVRRIGVGVGPGSFTGLRIGVATGRALALATGAEVVPVSTPDALAVAAGAREGTPILAAIDARRGEIFVTVWADGRRVHGPAAVRPEALAGLVAEHAPGALAVGDGAVRYRDVLEAAGVEVPADSDTRNLVYGSPLMELADLGTPIPRTDLAPDYVRRPDVDDR
jgi:tRNA threonylcarbamoyladenosine biosynthesis protein TsaB